MLTPEDKSLKALETELAFICRAVNALPTSDFEVVDDINRALQSIKAELEALRLALALDATNDLSLPVAA